MSENNKDGAPQWVEIIEPESKEKMFANPLTGEILFSPPTGASFKPMSNNQWWELFDTGSNNPYYYNALTGETVWDRPADGADIISLTKLQKTSAEDEQVSSKTKTPSPTSDGARRSMERKTSSEIFAPISSSIAPLSPLSVEVDGQRFSAIDGISMSNASASVPSSSLYQFPGDEGNGEGGRGGKEGGTHSKDQRDRDSHGSIKGQKRPVSTGEGEKGGQRSSAAARPVSSEGAGGGGKRGGGGEGGGGGGGGGVVDGGGGEGTVAIVAPKRTKKRSANSRSASVEVKKEDLPLTKNPRDPANPTGSNRGPSSMSYALKSRTLESPKYRGSPSSRSPKDDKIVIGGSLRRSPGHHRAPAPPRPSSPTSSSSSNRKHSAAKKTLSLAELRPEDNKKTGASTLPSSATASSTPSPAQAHHPPSTSSTSTHAPSSSLTSSTIPRAPPGPALPSARPARDSPIMQGKAVETLGEFEDLAQHKKGLFRRKVTIANMLCWTKDPIKQPMIMTRDKQLKKDAVEMFKLVLQYMGDRKTKFKEDNAIALEITSRAWEKKGLRDELYIQLCRQTSGNDRPKSLEAGWELFTIALAFFPPSNKFRTYLEGYLWRHVERSALIKGVPVEVYAQYCHKKVERMALTGAKKGLKKPTLEEVVHAKKAPFNPSLFGTSIEEVMELQAERFPGKPLPWVVETLSETVLRLQGPQTEGIFRVPGDIDEVNSLKLHLDKWNAPPPALGDPHIPASLLKLWFRELESPLIPEDYYQECINNYDKVRNAISLVQTLPDLNRELLLYLIKFLRKFITPEHIEYTKMGVENISMVWAPNFLRCPSEDHALIFQNTRKEMAFLRLLLKYLDTDSPPPPDS